MKDTMKNSLAQIAFFACAAAIALAVAGCNSPGKVRDIELKGMYVNGYSEVLAIGQGKLTSIPGEREALAAHYEEDTAWLQPNIKTHTIDIFLVGTNTVENADKIIEHICKAFSDVAPSVSKDNAAVAKSVATATPLGVVKSGGEVRKTVELAKGAAANASTSSTLLHGSENPSAKEDCPDDSCAPSTTCTGDACKDK